MNQKIIALVLSFFLIFSYNNFDVIEGIDTFDETPQESNFSLESIDGSLYWYEDEQGNIVPIDTNITLLDTNFDASWTVDDFEYGVNHKYMDVYFQDETFYSQDQYAVNISGNWFRNEYKTLKIANNDLSTVYTIDYIRSGGRPINVNNDPDNHTSTVRYNEVHDDGCDNFDTYGNLTYTVTGDTIKQSLSLPECPTHWSSVADDWLIMENEWHYNQNLSIYYSNHINKSNLTEWDKTEAVVCRYLEYRNETNQTIFSHPVVEGIDSNNNSSYGWYQLQEDTLWMMLNYTWLKNDAVYPVEFDPSFTLEDTQDDGGYYYGVWGDGTYIYTACHYLGVRAYSFDGSSFTLKDTQDDGGIYFDVWGDGDYIYTACYDDGVRAYSFDGSSFTLKDTQDNSGYYMDVWGDGSYIYTACGTSGVRAYSFDGTSFSLEDTQDDGGDYRGIWGDETYIYTACGASGVRAYSFDGSSFTLKDTRYDGSDNYMDVWGDGTYTYTACYGDGVRAYSFDGSSFTLKDTQDDGGNYRGIWGDGSYIYTACGASGVRAYSFDGTSFSLEDTQDDGGDYYSVWGDETYIYTACYVDGIRAYSGFESGTSAPTITINFAGNLSDSEGPNWRPPSESVELTGVWSDGYYTNHSYQHEDWIYINCTVTNATNVYLDWLNGSTWTNTTEYDFINTAGDYWEINTSGNITTCEGYWYSFNINATGGGGSTICKWNKTAINAKEPRRAVQLNCTPVDSNYTILYIWNTSYTPSAIDGDGQKADRMDYDGESVGTATPDFGELNNTIPGDLVQENYCTNFVSYNLELGQCWSSFTLENIYFHVWSVYTTDNVDRYGYDKDRNSSGNDFDQYIQPGDNISYLTDTGILSDINSTVNLHASKMTCSPTKTFTDNDIYEFNFKAYDASTGGGEIGVVSNRSILSYIILNVPDNNTLNNTDWSGSGGSMGDRDGDGLQDWTEIYETNTNPALADTDGDGVNDSDEYQSGSDPNDYTDTTTEFIWIDITNNSWDIGNVQMGTSVYTNASKTFIADMDNCTVNTDLKLQITSDASTWSSATSGNSPDADTYRLNASIDTWTSENQIVTASATTISSNIAAGTNETFDLRFDAPTSTSTGSSQSITVTASLVKT
ncbi:MAG: hypothetical protein KGY67_00560 [Candidatus Thermoplasmatota archaeon]|nr:hypothetical protein [Candidatus Thermoplasmatota archaeon]